MKVAINTEHCINGIQKASSITPTKSGAAMLRTMWIRAEKENVIYANAGDMFRGSVIDSEYQGLSTIDLMNNLRPDVATPEPATEYQGERVRPYSLCNKVAPTNEVAVCPEGHELAELPSGRISLAVYLIPLTSAAMITYDIPTLESIRGQSLRPSTPANFSPSVMAGPKYCE